jgi:hypothetical protein
MSPARENQAGSALHIRKRGASPQAVDDGQPRVYIAVDLLGSDQRRRNVDFKPVAPAKFLVLDTWAIAE